MRTNLNTKRRIICFAIIRLSILNLQNGSKCLAKLFFTSIGLARSSLSKAAAAQNVQPPNHSQILLIDCGMYTITFGRRMAYHIWFWILRLKQHQVYLNKLSPRVLINVFNCKSFQSDLILDKYGISMKFKRGVFLHHNCKFGIQRRHEAIGFPPQNLPATHRRIIILCAFSIALFYVAHVDNNLYTDTGITMHINETQCYKR